jgi:hypothetical protein
MRYKVKQDFWGAGSLHGAGAVLDLDDDSCAGVWMREGVIVPFVEPVADVAPDLVVEPVADVAPLTKKKR